KDLNRWCCMLNNPKFVGALLVAVAAFGFVFSIWMVVLLLYTGKRKAQSDMIADRMGMARPAIGEGRVLRLWHDGKEATTLVPGLPQRRDLLERLEQMRLDAGWQTPAQTITMGVAAGSL